MIIDFTFFFLKKISYNSSVRNYTNRSYGFSVWTIYSQKENRPVWQKSTACRTREGESMLLERNDASASVWSVGRRGWGRVVPEHEERLTWISSTADCRARAFRATGGLLLKTQRRQWHGLRELFGSKTVVCDGRMHARLTSAITGTPVKPCVRNISTINCWKLIILIERKKPLSLRNSRTFSSTNVRSFCLVSDSSRTFIGFLSKNV